MSTGPGGGSEFEGGGLSQTVSMTSLRSGASDASLQRAASESNGGGEEETSPSGSRASTPSRARRRRRRRMAAKATSTLTKTMLIVSMLLPYSWKYWWELNLAVEPKIAIARILADLNLAFWYGIAICIICK